MVNNILPTNYFTPLIKIFNKQVQDLTNLLTDKSICTYATRQYTTPPRGTVVYRNRPLCVIARINYTVNSKQLQRNKRISRRFNATAGKFLLVPIYSTISPRTRLTHNNISQTPRERVFINRFPL